MDLKEPVARSLGVTFYSRRAAGPYYRWRYARIRGRWQWSRMHALELAERELVIAPWKGVPAALKSSLNAHYVD
jgi:hypothetical protein